MPSCVVSGVWCFYPPFSCPIFFSLSPGNDTSIAQNIHPMYWGTFLSLMPKTTVIFVTRPNNMPCEILECRTYRRMITDSRVEKQSKRNEKEIFILIMDFKSFCSTPLRERNSFDLYRLQEHECCCFFFSFSCVCVSLWARPIYPNGSKLNLNQAIPSYPIDIIPCKKKKKRSNRLQKTTLIRRWKCQSLAFLVRRVQLCTSYWNSYTAKSTSNRCP